MLDESLLDSPEALGRADAPGLLRGAAEAGAHVRTALRQATESGLTELRPDGRPRAVLVAGPGPATASVADLLGALTHGAMTVTLLRPTGPLAAPEALRWTLPGWAGPVDLLIVCTLDGSEAGLTALIEQAHRRGCSVVSVSPPATPLAALTAETHGLAMPVATGPIAVREQEESPDQQSVVAAPGSLWAQLTPLLVLSDRLGLFPAGQPALQSLADRLDHVAERCGPAIATYSNPGKTLATELSDTLPLLWSEGAVADAVARHCATTFAALPGIPALAARLPEAMTVHRALLAGALSAAAGPDEFFRDRVEEPQSLHARVVLLREEAGSVDSAVVAVRELASAQDAPLSELEPADGSGPLETAAELIGTADFAAVYLALADGGPSLA